MAVMLTTAMAFEGLHHDKDVILLQLVGLLELKWTDTEVVYYLSEDALDFILRHSKPISKVEHPAVPSLIEYFRFRGILLWCASKCHFASTEANHFGTETTKSHEANKLVSVAAPPVQAMAIKLVKEALPSEENIKLVNGTIRVAREVYGKGAMEVSTIDIAGLSKSKWSRAQEEMLEFFLSHRALKEAAMRLILHIDWVRIPVALFVKVVEPLKLIPDSKLVDVFRFHSLESAMRVKLNCVESSWVHNGTFEVLKDGFVLKRNISLNGSAMCLLANRLDEEVCAWRFIVESLQHGVELGFLCGERMEEASRAWDFQKNCGEGLGDSGSNGSFMSRVIYMSCSEKWGGSDDVWFSHTDLDLDFLADVSSFNQVEFRFHRGKRSCDIIVDDRNLGTIWSDLPGRSVYPIVSFEDSASGVIRLDIVSGFEIPEPCQWIGH